MVFAIFLRLLRILLENSRIPEAKELAEVDEYKTLSIFFSVLLAPQRASEDMPSLRRMNHVVTPRVQ